jgi:hypothetical protein
VADSLAVSRWCLIVAACGVTEPLDPEPSWAHYTIPSGSHVARLADATPGNPLQAFTEVVARDYELVLDPSASYTLETPTEPADQYDWNKLPGLSDCDETDLARDGAMFGWRWRLDLEPHVLEVTAYANNAGVHLTSESPLFVLDALDLEARAPIRYTVEREATRYRFAAIGDVRGRRVEGTAALPRRCIDTPVDVVAWAGDFYFGGTTPAPHDVTAAIREK